jgi:L-fucose isomerase-like protein
VCHSLMKDEGIPSACEEDLNALAAMTILQLLGNRPPSWATQTWSPRRSSASITRCRRCA